ncbi:anthranilate phosphoribosyltransferase [Plantactinospora endophytica]|uniref:Anthranilate phosphoribosyltransferase n=1 Tax=Plantactinospora endophytica TaxID=673535 RepID=A0ABQ4E6Y2_9ACTN|nr:anthranilate phosphoribosyltransferase [Plantactinospora endophytica]GIG90424.1 anthranilate phosphoribosyltransferase 1 [Plantactinospora endophytica]
MDTVDRNWPELLTTLLRREDLGADDTAWVMDQVMRGRATDACLAGFLVALRAKGVTVPELTGLLRAMREHALTVEVPGDAVDIVGTGGDGAHTVNISTMAAIVAAAAGVRVVKHGNRSVSSRSGSADLLERLGLPLRLTPAQIAELVQEVGIAFCFAPVFHPAMRHAAPVRRELGTPTVFNLLGPLANPAAPSGYAIGVADPEAAPLVAGVLAERGVPALVFRGDDGLDELTVTTTSRVWSVHAGQVRQEVFDPRDLGLPYSPLAALRTDGPEHSAEVAREVLAGVRGPVRDAVLLSAAAGIAVRHRPELPVTERLADGLGRAAEAIDSGRGEALLQRWVEIAGKLTAEE